MSAGVADRYSSNIMHIAEDESRKQDPQKLTWPHITFYRNDVTGHAKPPTRCPPCPGHPRGIFFDTRLTRRPTRNSKSRGLPRHASQSRETQLGVTSTVRPAWKRCALHGSGAPCMEAVRPASKERALRRHGRLVPELAPTLWVAIVRMGSESAMLRR